METGFANCQRVKRESCWLETKGSNNVTIGVGLLPLTGFGEALFSRQGVSRSAQALGNLQTYQIGRLRHGFPAASRSRTTCIVATRKCSHLPLQILTCAVPQRPEHQEPGSQQRPVMNVRPRQYTVEVG